MERNLHKAYQEVEKNHWWFVGRRKLIHKIIDKFLENRESKSKILDIGCNSGFLVNELNNKKNDVYGCDVDKWAVEYGQNKGVKNLKVSSFPRLGYSDNEFDAVTCLDVLEHIENDREALKEINRIIKPGGIAIITVPAFHFLWGLQDEVSHHFRRYNKRELLAKIKSASSWQIKRATYFNSLLFFPILLVRKITNLLKLKRDSDFEINNKFSNLIFKTIFLFEIWLLKIISFPFGVSLLVVAKKK